MIYLHYNCNQDLSLNLWQWSAVNVGSALDASQRRKRWTTQPSGSYSMSSGSVKWGCDHHIITRGLQKNCLTVRFYNNPILCNSAFRPITFPVVSEFHLRLPHISIISPYCTAAHGPVTSMAFILTPVFILRTTCDSALIAEHYYSYLLSAIWPVVAVVISLNIVVSCSMNYSKLQTESRFFLSKTEPVPNRCHGFLGEPNWTESQKSILQTPSYHYRLKASVSTACYGMVSAYTGFRSETTWDKILYEWLCHNVIIHRHGQGGHLPPPLEGSTCSQEHWKIERQPARTAFWAFFRCANALKLSASGALPDPPDQGLSPGPDGISAPRLPL